MNDSTYLKVYEIVMFEEGRIIDMVEADNAFTALTVHSQRMGFAGYEWLADDPRIPEDAVGVHMGRLEKTHNGQGPDGMGGPPMPEGTEAWATFTSYTICAVLAQQPWPAFIGTAATNAGEFRIHSDRSLDEGRAVLRISGGEDADPFMGFTWPDAAKRATFVEVPVRIAGRLADALSSCGVFGQYDEAEDVSAFVEALRRCVPVKKHLVVTYDVTELSEDEAGALEGEAYVQAERSDDHPSVNVVSTEVVTLTSQV